MHELFKFESDLISMTKNIKFKPANNDINRRITILEIIQLASVGLASHNIRAQVPSNIPVHNQFIKSEHLKTTKYLTDINNWTEKNLMMLNQKKTKQIIFNFNRGKQFATEVELKKEPLEVVINEVKLLGVIISNDLKWHKNTNYLTKKANKKMRMLHLAAKFTKNRDHIYQTFIRSNLEFSSTVWHSSLTSADRQDIERIQKAALKVILGKDYDGYDKSLMILKMESLEQRRESMALKFVKSGLKELEFFPLRKTNHGMTARNSERYHVKSTKNVRYKDSAVPFLRRLLNKDTFDKKENLRRIINYDKVSKKLEGSESKNSRVNYICNVDVIT